jgi:CRISPR-associated protein Csm1
MQYEDYLLASLLHDIGILLRTGGDNKSHSELGAEFIEKYFPAYKEAAEAVRNHHDPSGDHQERITAADNLSLVAEESEEMHQLLSPFSRITLKDRNLGSPKVMPVGALNLNRDSIFPQQESSPQYENLKEEFLEEVEHLPKSNFFAMFNSLLYLLEKYTWCIPSPSKEDTIISLFDHLKTTCAIASCLREDPDRLMLINGDISGVQDFIYTITSKGAAKSLKGRSFFLDLLNDVIARYILYNLNLPLTNLLYCGGGNFLILAPASEEKNLGKIKTEILNSLFKFSRGDLYIALEAESFSKSVLKTPEEFKGAFSNLKQKLGQSKKRKHLEFMTEDNFSKIFGPFGEGGISEFCEVCKNESKPLTGGGEDPKMCSLCDSFKSLTSDLPTAKYIVEAFTPRKPRDIQTDTYEGILGSLGFKFLFKSSLDEIHDIEGDKKVVYRIQDTCFLFKAMPEYAKGFWFMPNVIPLEEQNGQVKIKSIDKIVKKSKGIKRLAVLRADVDNLGAILFTGLPTFSLADLSGVSRLLTLFFQGYLPKYIEEKHPNLIYIVYSGGDDCFILGPWNLIMDLASEIRTEFTEFTCSNQNITLSTGVSLIHHQFPIYKAAKMAGDALKNSKDRGKDRITTFGTDFQWDTEFSKVMNLKEKIENVLVKKKVSRALLYKISETFGDFRQFKKEMEKGSLATHRIWRLFYVISRFAKRHESAEKELSEIREEYMDIVWRSRNWREGKIDNKPEIIPAAVRWAEFLTRGEKNGRENKEDL